MNKRVTVRIQHPTGTTLETLNVGRIRGVYTSTAIMITSFYIAYEGIFESQALETTKADYKLLVGVMDVPELNI